MYRVCRVYRVYREEFFPGLMICLSVSAEKESHRKTSETYSLAFRVENSGMNSDCLICRGTVLLSIPDTSLTEVTLYRLDIIRHLLMGMRQRV